MGKYTEALSRLIGESRGAISFDLITLVRQHQEEKEFIKDFFACLQRMLDSRSSDALRRELLIRPLIVDIFSSSFRLHLPDGLILLKNLLAQKCISIAFLRDYFNRAHLSHLDSDPSVQKAYMALFAEMFRASSDTQSLVIRIEEWIDFSEIAHTFDSLSLKALKRLVELAQADPAAAYGFLKFHDLYKTTFAKVFFQRLNGHLQGYNLLCAAVEYVQVLQGLADRGFLSAEEAEAFLPEELLQPYLKKNSAFRPAVAGDLIFSVAQFHASLRLREQQALGQTQSGSYTSLLDAPGFFASIRSSTVSTHTAASALATESGPSSSNSSPPILEGRVDLDERTVLPPFQA